MERKGGFKYPGEEVGQVGTGETREGNEVWGGGEDGHTHQADPHTEVRTCWLQLMLNPHPSHAEHFSKKKV